MSFEKQPNKKIGTREEVRNGRKVLVHTFPVPELFATFEIVEDIESKKIVETIVTSPKGKLTTVEPITEDIAKELGVPYEKLDRILNERLIDPEFQSFSQEEAKKAEGAVAGKSVNSDLFELDN